MFLGDVSFEGVCFMGLAWFEASKFSLSASFERSVFVGIAQFGHVSFSGDARFEEVQFLDDAQFGNAQFEAVAFFVETSFFNDAHFYNAKFSEEAWLQSLSVSGTGWFDGVEFASDVTFEESLFSGNTWFKETRFSGEAKFDRATFEEFAWFNGVYFLSKAEFYRLKANDLLYYEDCKFFGEANYSEANIVGEIVFDGVEFESGAVFAKMIVPGRFVATGTGFGKEERNWRGAFFGAHFDRVLIWRGMAGKFVSAFEGITLERGILRDRLSDADDLKTHRKALGLALNAIDEDGKLNSESALRSLEAGALKLKLAMEKDSDKLREQRFYRLELLARRKQTGTPWTEKTFSFAYEKFANYGASIGRPLIAIIGFTLLFGLLVYFPLSTVFSDGELSNAFALSFDKRFDPDLWTSLSFSVSNIFPLGPFRELRSDYFSELSSFETLVMGTVAILQSVISALLLFLSGLAVRRRFQIS